MRVLFLESFCGGSHESVAKGFASHTRHEVEILSLPPRFWKWRMRGAALWFARKIEDIADWDLVFATDMMDLTDFKALAGPACPPVALYFHENQLSYPLAPGETRDLHLGFTNLVSAWAADLVLFNSAFHRDEFLRAARGLIRKMPDARPGWMVDGIRAKTRVLYPGVALPKAQGPEGDGLAGGRGRDPDPPLIIWNHRWEYDKNPDGFFRVMAGLKEKQLSFCLAVLGERYGTAPEIFARAEQALKDEAVVWGYQPSSEAYRSWLCQGTCVVSTAIQENFGISVMEAVARGCFPLLPNRLSYPELIPPSFHSEVLYRDEEQLKDRLEAVLTAPDRYQGPRQKLAAHAGKFAWPRIIMEWDQVLEDLYSQDSKS